jgi:3-isopropylmalate/(R)-2-methylmalate dehydratase small subunit
LALECQGISQKVKDGDLIEVNLTEGIILNKTNGEIMDFIPLPEFMLKVLNSGGIIPYLKKVDDW